MSNLRAHYKCWAYLINVRKIKTTKKINPKIKIIKLTIEKTPVNPILNTDWILIEIIFVFSFMCDC